MSFFHNKIRIICLAVAFVLIVTALVFLWRWEKQYEDFSSDSEWEMSDFIEYENELYRIRDDVNTLLIMGVDKFSSDADSDSYNNEQCADFLLLLAIDRTSGKCSAIQINRDTMADVTVLGIGGKKLGKTQQQITLSHTYGTGGQDSCRNTVRAVSDLFGGLHIDDYVCLTMDAVGVLNDLVGGVTVSIGEDLTAIDPSFTEGATVQLSAEQALMYIRQRSELSDSSNASRMNRQKQYMNALYSSVMKYFEKNNSFPTEAVTSLVNYTSSDLDVSELEKKIDTLADYKRGDIYMLNGEYSVGEYVEFYPDEADMKRLVVELFYEKK